MEIKIQALTSDHAESFAQLSAEEYGQNSELTTLSYFSNKFLKNPLGISEIISLEEQGKSVGRLILLPRKFKFLSQYITIIFPTEFLIEKDYRDFINLVSLFKKFKKNRKRQNCLVVPNKTSANIWDKLGGVPFFGNLLVGVSCIRPFATLIVSLNLSTGLKFAFLDDVFSFMSASLLKVINLFSNFKCEGVSLSDLEKEDLEKNFSESELRGCRNFETLKWRLSFRKKSEYFIVRILKNRKVEGYAIFAVPEESYGQRPIVLLDLICAPELRNVSLRAVGRWAFNKGIKLKCNLVLLLIFSKEVTGRPFSIFPFFKVPQKLIPESDKIFLDLETNIKNQSFFLTLFDCDMF